MLDDRSTLQRQRYPSEAVYSQESPGGRERESAEKCITLHIAIQPTDSVRAQTRSRTIEHAWPPPMHAEPTTYRLLRRCRVCTRLLVMRAPDAASGWPRAEGGEGERVAHRQKDNR